MDAININNLTKKYKDVTAVDHLTLTIKQGELFALLGINGAGKTTTIKMLCGLIQPTEGEVQINGQIGISPQETAVAPNLSVQENLELICGVHGFSKEKTKEKVASLSAQMGLQSILTKRAGKLSGGWQRRLSIAMALICQPQILFLDVNCSILFRCVYRVLCNRKSVDMNWIHKNEEKMCTA